MEVSLVHVFLATIVFYGLYHFMFAVRKPKKTKVVKRVETQNDEGNDNRRKLTILYGSQSGTAEEFANEMAAESSNHGFSATSIDLGDYDHEMDLENETTVVLLLATFGEGEPTDTSIEFYDWCMSSLVDDDSMSNLDFAVFALGNRQYENFCNIGRDVDKKLYKNGANRIIAHGEGDDDGTLNEDFASWKEQFYEAAKKKYNMHGAVSATKRLEVPFQVIMNDNTDKCFQNYVGGVEGFQPESKFKPRLVPVSVNKQLRNSTKEGSTVHIELDISKSSLRYMTADNLGVFSCNDMKLVAQMVKRLGYKMNDLFKIEFNNEKQTTKHVFPKVCSVGDAIAWYCDFTAMVRISTLKQMAVYCESKEEEDDLTNKLSDNHKHKLLDDQNDFLEIMNMYPSMNIPLDAFFHMVPKLVHHPRFYTISSSSQVNPDSISITVVLANAVKPRGRSYNGICSNYLARQKPQRDQICVFVRPSSFRLPRNPSTPVIMVGPGTGVAPFRAFWQEGLLMKEKDKELGPWSLYFGCRYSKEDWIYSSEMKEMKAKGVLSELNLAFSRDNKDNRIYVQTLLSNERNSANTYDMIHNKKGVFYVCGSTTMGRAIKSVVVDLVKKYGRLSEEKAALYVKEMQQQHRYIQELWS